MAADYRQLWDNALQMISHELTTQGKQDEFDRWFKPVSFGSFDVTEHILMLEMPSRTHCDYIEKTYLQLFGKAIVTFFGKTTRLKYHIPFAGQAIVEETETEMVQARKNAAKKQDDLPELDSQLDPHLNFRTFIEGESNKLSRSVGISVAEHPKSSKFNPYFIFGPSGCGKTHLINAIGVRAKEIYPNLRVLYVSARIFQQQYTTAVAQNTVNDFIAFYQTLDMLIVDDIQEWATLPGTQNTFFHIFDYLFRRGKRIILASDRSPSQLRGMHERLITRFACGATCELMKPNLQLCIDILRSKIARDALTIPEDVVLYIAENVNGSVRDLQGVINSLMVYSIVDNSPIDVPLAERIIKRIVAVTEESPITLDMILDCVCDHCNVTSQDINGKSRKKEFAQARQITMYLAKKMTNLQDSRIGRLVGGRDHSTVVHSYKKVEADLPKNKSLRTLIGQIEKDLKSNRSSRRK